MSLEAYYACFRQFGLRPTAFGSPTTTVFMDHQSNTFTVPKGELLSDSERLSTVKDFAAVHGFDLPQNIKN